VKFFESIAHGIPVVATDIGGIGAMIRESGCGRVLSEPSAEGIATAVEEMLSQPELLQTMGRQGLAAVREKYNWDLLTPRLLAMYRGSTDEPAHSRRPTAAGLRHRDRRRTFDLILPLVAQGRLPAIAASWRGRVGPAAHRAGAQQRRRLEFPSSPAPTPAGTASSTSTPPSPASTASASSTAATGTARACGVCSAAWGDASASSTCP